MDKQSLNKDFKVLVLDLDGTLTNSAKDISDVTRLALRKAQEKGIKIVLASGRPTYGIVPLAVELELEKFGGFILSFNGGKIINWQTREVICEKELSERNIPLFYDFAKDHGVELISYQDQDIITERADDQYVQKEAKLNRMSVRQVEKFTDVINHPVPKCLIVGDSEVLVGLEKKMNERFGQEMSIYRSEPFFLELMPLGIDKANSLKVLLDYLGLDKDEMIACGDGFNDLSMIKFAGLGVAMANAQPAVKEVADFITLSNDEDGVAHVIDKFILQN